MQAAMAGTQAGLMKPLFCGNSKDIQEHADRLGWDISDFEIIHADDVAEAAKVAAHACGEGRASVLMKGQLHSDTFLKAALNRDAGLRTGERLVHVFHITHPDSDKPLLISDAAVNVKPDLATQKASIEAVVKILHSIGNLRPKIAILSATETPVTSIPSSIHARELRDWARRNINSADFSGPLALDLILSPQAVSIKKISDDPVAGNADAIIVQDIESGNAIFKSLVYLSGGCAAGIIFGAKVPILLTSRADPPAARLAAIALAAIMSAE